MQTITILSSDTEKLQRWAEHSDEVSNCCNSVRQCDQEALSDIFESVPSCSDHLQDNEELVQPITEEEIRELRINFKMAMPLEAMGYQLSY